MHTHVVVLVVGPPRRRAHRELDQTTTHTISMHNSLTYGANAAGARGRRRPRGGANAEKGGISK